MDVVHPRCAALDLGKDVVVAGVRTQHGSRIERECRTYGMTTAQILALKEWLLGHRVTHVVMEATGAYWKSIWHLLEEDFELTLANPAAIRNLPGRKSDVNDATWMADLHAHGLIRGSFVPPAPIAALRELTRTRKQLVREIARHTQRIQKTLDVANIKITGPISDLLGLSGRAILRALVAGETDPGVLAGLVHPRVRASRETLMEALNGRLTAAQRHLIRMHLDLIDNLAEAVAGLDAEIGKLVEPFRPILTAVAAIPGLGVVNVPALIAEIGVDMSRFPTHRNLISWARLCRRLDESAGKVHSNRTLPGANWLKPLLIQAAHAAIKVKDSYYHAQYLRLRARRGSKKAIVAVAASILTTVYYVIRDRKPYQDLGADYFDRRDRSRIARRHLARLRQLGYHVEIKGAVA
jgi:transposase